MNIKHKLNFLKNHYPKVIFGFFVILLSVSYIRIFAIGSPYQPGSTLDPACQPGEVNCIVSYDLTYFKQDGNSFSGTATLGTNDANDLVFETSGTEKMRVGTNGNVSITGIAGQTSSVPQLSILGVASTAKSIQLATYAGTVAAHFIGDDGGALFGAGLAISASGTNSQLFLQPVSSGRNVNVGSATALGSKLGVKGDASGNPVFTAFNSSSVVLLTVLNGGNIGIGTSTPFSSNTAAASLWTGTQASNNGNIIGAGGYATLGKVAAGSYGAVGTNFYLNSSGSLRRVFADSGSLIDFNSSGFMFKNFASSTADSSISTTTLWNLDSTGHWRAGTDNIYDIGNNGSQRPRTGYFGTSVIAPLFATTAQQADFGGSSGASVRVNAGSSGSGYPGIGYNIAFQTTINTYNYRATDTAYMIGFGGPNNDRMMFNVATSGTAGNAITWTEAMTIKNNGNVGIGTINPTNKMELVAGTLTDGQNALSITGTQAGTITTSNIGAKFDITTPTGNDTGQTREAVRINLSGNYTGSLDYPYGLYVINSVGGTGASLTDVSNIAVVGTSNATTTGSNIGGRFTAVNGIKNTAGVFLAITNKNSGTNVGIASFALNAGTSPIQVGGFFGLMSSAPTFTSAALIADNGATTSPIFLARDNGSTVFTIADGGNVTLTGAFSAPTGTTHILGNVTIANASISSQSTLSISANGGATGSIFLNSYTGTLVNHQHALGGFTLTNGTVKGISYTANYTNAGAGGTSTGYAINSEVSVATAVASTVTMNNFSVLGIYNTSAGTTTVRGFYYNPTISGSVGLTSIAFENTTGDVRFGTTSGNVSIGNTNSTYKLEVGSASVSGIVARFVNSTGTCDINPTTTALACSSDRTLKKNITPLDTSILDKVLSLNPVTYNWNSESDSTPAHNGFIAQEVESLFPDLVFTDATTGLKSLNYMGLIPYTVKALQQLNLKVSLLPDITDASLATKIRDFLSGIGNGIAKVDKVETKNLCVSDDSGSQTCITKAQLDAFLQSGGSSGGSSTPQPQEETPVVEDPQDEVTPPNEETPPAENNTEPEVIPTE